MLHDTSPTYGAAVRVEHPATKAFAVEGVPTVADALKLLLLLELLEADGASFIAQQGALVERYRFSLAHQSLTELALLLRKSTAAANLLAKEHSNVKEVKKHEQREPLDSKDEAETHRVAGEIVPARKLECKSVGKRENEVSVTHSRNEELCTKVLTQRADDACSEIEHNVLRD